MKKISKILMALSLIFTLNSCNIIFGTTSSNTSSSSTNTITDAQENISKLKEFYDVDVRVETSEEIKPGKFKIEIEKTYQDFLNN